MNKNKQKERDAHKAKMAVKKLGRKNETMTINLTKSQDKLFKDFEEKNPDEAVKLPKFGQIEAVEVDSRIVMSASCEHQFKHITEFTKLISH